MALTHFWIRPTELPADVFADATKDIERVVTASGIRLAGFDGTGKPQFHTDAVVFNGDGRAACEPFEVHQVEFDIRGRPEKFSFCKTHGLPYDFAAKMALIVFKRYFGSTITITSDESDEAWATARERVQLVVGYGDDFKLGPKR